MDYAATTPLRAEALAAMLPYLEGGIYNPSSLHREGRRARTVLEEARERIARVLGVRRKEVLFVGGGSQADSLAIIGMARAGNGRHVLSSAIEHHAILHALDRLRDEGYDVTLLPVDRHGFVDPERFAAELRPDTVLASIMYANNEIGTIQPVARFAALARERGVLFHTDAIAAPGWLPLADLGADAISLAAHKFGGPAGFGILCVRESVAIEPIVYGGGQEFGKHSGTESVAAAAGAATALELAESERRQRVSLVEPLRDRLEIGLLASLALLRVNGANPRLAGIANLSVAGVKAEALCVRLDLDGIAVSPGSACTSGIAEPSHVIATLQDGNGGEAVRFSMGSSTTQEEVDRVLQVMPVAVSELRRT